MAGLMKHGADANPFGSKYQETSGGQDAGNGRRTYTKPSYTLFVVGIPDAESSDAVEKVFERDRGFLQCRPVGHKQARRMVFVDYGSIECATAAMQAHQGHKWDDVDEGLKIDYDQDARAKRNTAMDQGLYEKFFAIGPRVAKPPSDAELFARLRSEALEAARPPPAAPAKRAGGAAAKRAAAKPSAAARLRVKAAGGAAAAAAGAGAERQDGAGGTAEGAPAAAGSPGGPAGGASAEAGRGTLGSLAEYGSESSAEDEGCEEDEEEEEEEESEEEEDDPKRRRVAA